MTVYLIAWASSRRFLKSILITILVLICTYFGAPLPRNHWFQLELYIFKLQQMVMTVFWIAWASFSRCFKSILITVLVLICVSAHLFTQITDRFQVELYGTKHDIQAAMEVYEYLLNSLRFLQEMSQLAANIGFGSTLYFGALFSTDHCLNSNFMERSATFKLRQIV